MEGLGDYQEYSGWDAEMLRWAYARIRVSFSGSKNPPTLLLPFLSLLPISIILILIPPLGVFTSPK